MKKKFPIFILGCDRSGTTLLRLIMDSFTNIGCPSETKFIYNLLKIKTDTASHVGIKTLKISDKELFSFFKKTIEKFMQSYLKSRKKKRWCEKTTHNLLNANLLNNIFKKKVLFIGIVRDPLNVINSLNNKNIKEFSVLKKYMKNNNKINACAQHWYEMNNKLKVFAKNNKKNFLLIKYEELTVEPQNTLKKICKFIDEKYNPNFISYWNFKHEYFYDDKIAVRKKYIKLREINKTNRKKILKKLKNKNKLMKLSNYYNYKI